MVGTLYVCTDEPERVVKSSLLYPVQINFTPYQFESVEDIGINVNINDSEALAAHAMEWNYLYCADTGRYYYKTSSAMAQQGIIRYTFHVDVLMTYANQIKQETAVLDRQEKHGNLYIIDPEFPTENRSRVYFKEFPSGFDAALSYYLTIGG